ncbi:MAG: type II toxin-antitoxin system HicA family toxin [Deltaproteobacteria bacterium]|nr:type II toxin-antitoxin system HicA family toxin [Deltaproteobacteria bacterium]MBW2663211.1 type II toxin-antitoxin system HicA family toxin [Deltaproteobacteria bacterium]
MPEALPKLTAKEAEKYLLRAGFKLSRQKGSHRIYRKGSHRMVLPWHQGKILHPKIIKELFDVLR